MSKNNGSKGYNQDVRDSWGNTHNFMQSYGIKPHENGGYEQARDLWGAMDAASKGTSGGSSSGGQSSGGHSRGRK